MKFLASIKALGILVALSTGKIALMAASMVFAGLCLCIGFSLGNRLVEAWRTA